jgi:hypothetical protein
MENTTFKTLDEYDAILGIKPTPRSFKVGGKDIEDDGRVQMVLRFASVSNMVEFMENNFADQMGIRSLVASDKITAKRQFIASDKQEGGQRVSYAENEEIEL